MTPTPPPAPSNRVEDLPRWFMGTLRVALAFCAAVILATAADQPWGWRIVWNLLAVCLVVQVAWLRVEHR